MRREEAMAAVAAMILRAREVLERSTASHLVANALAPYVMETEGVDVGPLPTILESLSARVALDRRFRREHSGYPYVYPDAGVEQLLEELAAIWREYEQGHSPDLLRSLERATSADPRLSFKLRVRGGRWYVAAKRGRVVVASDDHPIAEVAIGEVLRSVGAK